MDRGVWWSTVHRVTRVEHSQSDLTGNLVHIDFLWWWWWWWFSCQLYSTLVTPWTVCSLPGSSPWDFPGKNTVVSCHFLLQGIFLPQELNMGLLHYRQISQHSATREARFSILLSNLFIFLTSWIVWIKRLMKIHMVPAIFPLLSKNVVLISIATSSK